jgi:hypothetical protein
MSPEDKYDPPNGCYCWRRVKHAAQGLWRPRIPWAAITTLTTFALVSTVHFYKITLESRLAMPEWLLLSLCPVASLALSVLLSFLLNYLQAPAKMEKTQYDRAKGIIDQAEKERGDLGSELSAAKLALEKSAAAQEHLDVAKATLDILKSATEKPKRIKVSLRSDQKYQGYIEFKSITRSPLVIHPGEIVEVLECEEIETGLRRGWLVRAE